MAKIHSCWTDQQHIAKYCIYHSNIAFQSRFLLYNLHTLNRFTALWNLSVTTRVSQHQKKHSPTHTHRGHQSYQSAFSIYYDPWHPPFSIHVLYSLFPQSLSPSFLWATSWSGTLHFILHTFLHPIVVFFSQHMPIPSSLQPNGSQYYWCRTWSGMQ